MINNREDAQRLVDQCRYLPPVPVPLSLPLPVPVPVPVPVQLYVPVPETLGLHNIAGDPKLIASLGTLLKASVPGAPQEPLLEISPPSRLMTMSRLDGGSDIT